MNTYSECDESPEITECLACGEISAEDGCPYCDVEPDRYWHIGKFSASRINAKKMDLGDIR